MDKSSDLISFGKRWSFNLNNVLNKNLDSKELIICWNFKRNDKVNRVFSKFNFNELYELNRRVGEEQRSFFEVITDERKHKVFFDIDIKGKNNVSKAKNFLEQFIKALLGIIDLDLEKDIFFYSSHSEEKRSYHILLNFKTDMKNNKILAEKISEKIEGENFLDLGVYNKNRQLRILGSSKVGEKRFKIWEREFSFKSKTYKSILENELKIEDEEKIIFFNSLVNFVQSDMKELIFEQEKEKEKEEKEPFFYQNGSFEEKELEEIKTLIEKVSSELKIREINGTIISLINPNGYYCPLCKRIHENENPYVYSLRDKVYFNCRRTEQKLFLGNLSSKKKFKIKDIFLLPNDYFKLIIN